MPTDIRQSVFSKYLFVILPMKTLASRSTISGTTNIISIKEWCCPIIDSPASISFILLSFFQNKNRGVEDIMIVSVDGLTGFVDAIGAVFPKAEIQRCIVHQVRYSTKFVNYKDLKPFVTDLKEVYQAATEELALENLDQLEEKWGKKYPSSVSSWRNNWPQLSTYFKYPPEIRKIIYTTNSIENFNRQLRKVTKSKTIFPTDDALFKILYLAMCDITEKWTGAGWNWGQTLDQLCIYFEDRISPADIE